LAKIAHQLDTTIEYLLDEGESLSTEECRRRKSFIVSTARMDDATKAKIRKMVKLWGDDT